jgi:Skp family chaperone for outer membrane proteins
LSPLALALALPLAAQDAAKPEPPRFAFFNIGQLVEGSTKAKAIFAELETTQKALNEKLKVKGDEYQKLQQQLQGGSLSEQGKEQIKKQLRDVEFDYKKLQDDSQAEFEKVRQKVMGNLYQVAGPIIDSLAKEQKLQVIFSGESAQAGQLIQWADDAWIRSFTQEVAKRFDASAATVPAAKPAPAVKPATPVTKPAAPATKPAAKPAAKPSTPPVATP